MIKAGRRARHCADSQGVRPVPFVFSALASLEHMNQYTLRELPKGNMLSPSWLDQRTALPAKDLIAPLLFSKETVVEEVFARAHGRTLFLRAMGEKAKAFGMKSTHIDDLGGVLTTNMTTATDMVHLLRALDQSKRYLLELSDRPLVAVPDEDGEEPSVILNTFQIAEAGGAIRGGMADQQSGNALFVFMGTTTGQTRSLAVAFSGSKDIVGDIGKITEYLSSGITYVAGKSDSVLTEQSVGFFTKIRMIWNRKRIGDMLLGTETASDHTATLRTAFPLHSL